MEARPTGVHELVMVLVWRPLVLLLSCRWCSARVQTRFCYARDLKLPAVALLQDEVCFVLWIEFVSTFFESMKLVDLVADRA